MSDWVETNADFSNYVRLTPNVICTQFCGSMQGVRSRRNVRESRRFIKNQVQNYVPKRPRTCKKNIYLRKKHLLNLLKPSIPDISASTLTIFRVEILEKLCQTMLWRPLKTRLRISQFLRIDKHFCHFLHSHLFPRTFLIRNVAFTPRKKASALRKFEMAIKQPTWTTFHFKISSNDQHNPSPNKKCNVSFLTQVPIKIDLGV